MKFFKYLIFTIFAFLSVNAYSKTVLQEYSSFGSFDSETSACAYLVSKSSPGSTYKIETSSPDNRCKVYYSSGNYQLGAWLITTKDECKAGATTVHSGEFVISNWKDDSELESLMNQSYAHFSGSKNICASSCEHKFLSTTNKSGDENSQTIVMTGTFVSTDKACTSPTSAPNGSSTGSKKPVECKNASGSNSYCDKVPNKSCPTGYKEGSFNGKAICIKESTKPDNPNDPNNPNNNSDNFDDSKIISAINASKDAITSAINDAVSSVSNALNTGFNSVTDALGTTNSKLEDVKANQKETTNAVNQNTTAVNAVKDAINNLKASVDATSKDNKETIKAINDSANTTKEAIDKHGKNITDAINENTKATNAVKDAVSNIKIPESGGGTIPSDGNNGEKLDGIKDSIQEGNGLLKDISQTLSDIKDFITEKPDLDSDGTGTESPNDQGIFDKKFNAVFSLSKSCPPDIPFNFDTQYLQGNFSISLNWLCIFFTFIAYPLQLVSHFMGLWILYEAVIRKEMKW